MAFSVVALLSDPARPLSGSRIAILTVVGYGAYAIIRCVVVWHARRPIGHPMLSLSVDLGVLALLLFATGACSPLVPLLTLPLLAAGLRWQGLGTLWVAAGAMLVMLAFGAREWLRHPDVFEPSDFLAQVTWLGVVVVLIGGLRALDAQSRRGLQRLATEADIGAHDVDALVRELPGWAADVLAAPRTLIVWEETDEPWLYFASSQDGDAGCMREAAGLTDLVAPELVDTDFLSGGDERRGQRALRMTPRGYAWWNGDPLGPVFRKRFAVTSVLSVRFDLEQGRGRLFVFDKREMTSDDLALADIVGRQIGGRLNQVYLLRRLAEQAAMEERTRLGRDLHDGALHAFAGVALELEALIRSSSKVGFTDTEARLRELQTSLLAEQRTLRMLIGRLREPQQAALQPSPVLAVRLKDLVNRIERRWHLEVVWSAAGLEALPASLADEIYLAVHEGLVNAARHAEASVITLDVAVDEQTVKIVISDNGRGFRFKGRYDQTALASLRLGPATLRERAVALNGSLTLDSTEHGTRVEMSLPVAEVVS